MNSSRIDMLTQMIELEPNDPFLHYALAMEFLKTDKDKSLDIMERVSQDYPDYLPNYYQLAFFLYEEGEYLKAREIADKGINLAENLNDSKAFAELKQLKLNIEFEI